MEHVQSPSAFFGASDPGPLSAARTVAVAACWASWPAISDAKPGAMPPSAAKSNALARAWPAVFDICLKFTVMFSMFRASRSASSIGKPVLLAPEDDPPACWDQRTMILSPRPMVGSASLLYMITAMAPVRAAFSEWVTMACAPSLGEIRSNVAASPAPTT